MTPLTWVAASPDGKLLGVGSESGRFLLWNLSERRVVRTEELGDFIVRAKWTPDGSRLLVATMGGLLQVYTGDGQPVGRIATGHPKLRDLAIDPRGPNWATCGSDIAVRIWDPATLALRFELRDGQTSSNAVGFLNGHIVAGYEDGYSVGWTADGQQKVDSGTVLAPPVYSLGVHPSGERVVYGGGKGGMQEMIVGEPKKWKPGTTWKGTPPKPIAVNAIDFASDGRMIAAFSDDHARIFDGVNDQFGWGLGDAFYERRPKPEWRTDFIVSGACFVPGSDRVATSHFDGNLRLWKDRTLEQTIPLGAEKPPAPPPPIEWVDFPGGTFEAGLTPDEIERLVRLNIQHNERFLEDDPDKFRWGSDREWFRERGGNAEFLRKVLTALCPRRKLVLKPFRLSKVPVRVGEFDEFCRGSDRDWKAPYQAKPEHAATGVPWGAATAYAALRGLRLPTSAEWEFAARGGAARRLFPWGPAWSSGADFFMGSGGAIFGWTPGSKPGLATPEGVLDLVAGAAEWCSDVYAPGDVDAWALLARKTAADFKPAWGLLRGGSPGNLLPNAVLAWGGPEETGRFRLACDR